MNKRNECEQTKRCVSPLVFISDLFGEANGARLVWVSIHRDQTAVIDILKPFKHASSKRRELAELFLIIQAEF